MKPKCYLTTPVFREIAYNDKLSEEKRKELDKLWKILERNSILKVSDNRFPSESEMKDIVSNWKPHVIGCHLSHKITEEMLIKSNVMAVCTSTAGYNHINRHPGILITHTPGVLHHTVADFTISLITSNLRNIVGNHNYIWEGRWKPGQKWDLDENLSSTIDSKTLGIIDHCFVAFCILMYQV